MSRRQGIFWLLTVPHPDFLPFLPNGVTWVKGQLERGDNTSYLHWQIVVAFAGKLSIRGVKSIFGDSAHCELSRSSAANDYVWKEATSVPNTKFELGVKPICRNSKTDWESVWDAAKSGVFTTVPAHVRVVNYRTLRTIASDHAVCIGMERSIYVFWGRTGTGKSRRAWDEAGLEAYVKDPRSKFWDGYSAQEHVVMDEFRGGIDISHVLRWFDRYPCRVEIKGSSRPLLCSKIWITSNLDPRLWYPDCDQETVDALMRRLTITHFA